MNEPHRKLNVSSNNSATANDVIVFEIGPYDVLMGRGAQVNQYDGNMYFRTLVSECIDDYAKTKKRQMKDLIARKIVAAITSKKGRFLQRIDDSPNASGEKGNAWTVVDNEIAVEKAKQSLRDKECRRRRFSHDVLDSSEEKINAWRAKPNHRTSAMVGVSQGITSGFNSEDIDYKTLSDSNMNLVEPSFDRNSAKRPKLTTTPNQDRISSICPPSFSALLANDTNNNSNMYLQQYLWLQSTITPMQRNNLINTDRNQINFQQQQQPKAELESLLQSPQLTDFNTASRQIPNHLLFPLRSPMLPLLRTNNTTEGVQFQKQNDWKDVVQRYLNSCAPTGTGYVSHPPPPANRYLSHPASYFQSPLRSTSSLMQTSYEKNFPFLSPQTNKHDVLDTVMCNLLRFGASNTPPVDQEKIGLQQKLAPNNPHLPIVDSHQTKAKQYMESQHHDEKVNMRTSSHSITRTSLSQEALEQKAPSDLAESKCSKKRKQSKTKT